MRGAEFYSVVNFSLVLGAILGSLFSICLQSIWNRLSPAEPALRACRGLRAKLTRLQQTLSSGTSGIRSTARRETTVKVAGTASRGLEALWAVVTDEPVASVKDAPNLEAWRRIDKPAFQSISMARRQRSSETGLVVLAGHRAEATEGPRAFNVRMAEEIVRRHFGVSLSPKPDGAGSPIALPLRQDRPEVETGKDWGLAWDLRLVHGMLRHAHHSSNHRPIARPASSGAAVHLDSRYRWA